MTRAPYARRFKTKPSLAETLRTNQAALDGLFVMRSPGREDAERIDTGAKAKRERPLVLTPPSDGGEAPVLRAVSQLLARHPAVAIAIRVNSGALYDERGVPIWHHRLVRGRGVCVDIIGALTDGRPFGLEVKRPTWRGVGAGTSDVAIREQQQALYIEHVRSIGGVAGFVRSVDEALALLGPQSGV